jgi:hypothetical protein
MGLTASADRGIVPCGPGRRMPWRLRLAAGAVSAALAGAAVLLMTGTAGASGAGADSYSQTVTVALHGMPHGTVNFYRGRDLHARVVMSGLTPGSSHAVDLLTSGGPGIISFGTITANSDGDANAYRASDYTGQWYPGSRLVIRMGAEKNPVAYRLIAETARLQGPGAVAHQLNAVDLSSGGVNYRPKGRATISYSSAEHTLTVTVRASGLTPGPHATRIHLGTCEAQGPVLYMLADLVADSRGRVVDAVRVIKNVTKPIPANGWYLIIHQGNSADILSKGKPAIYFRPLLCGNIHAR